MKKLIILILFLVVLSSLVLATDTSYTDDIPIYWSFDDNTTDDVSGFVGNITGGVTHNASCTLGGCYKFDGSGYITYPDMFPGIIACTYLGISVVKP